MEMTIGKRIAALRREKNLKQDDLAQMLEVSPQAVSKWENDQTCPDISLLPKLCKILGITTDELLTGNSAGVRMLPEQERKSLEDLTLRVRINSVAGDKVRVNLPMTLVKLCMEIGVDVVPNLSGENADMLHSVDMKKVVEMVEKGLIGKLVEIESAEGDTIEVVVE